MPASRRTAAIGIAVVGCSAVGALTAAPLAESRTLLVTPGGAAAAPCTATRPCADIAEAYARARGGDVILLAPGRYGDQAIPAARAAEGRGAVVIRPRGRGGVRLGNVDIQGSAVELRDVTTRGWYVRPGASRVTLRRVHSRGAGTFITSATRVRLLGGSIRGADSVDGLQVKAAEGRAEPRDIVIDRLTIADVTRRSRPDAHTECIQFTAGRGIVIRNSVFRGCSTQGVFLKEGLGGEIDDVLVENNWFGPLEGFNTLIVDDGVSNVVARFNLFAQAPRLGSGVGTSAITAYANAGTLRSCGRGVAYRGNWWSGARCGPGDRRGRPPLPIAVDEPPVLLAATVRTVPAGAGRAVGVSVRGRGPVTFLVRGTGRLRLEVRDPRGHRMGGRAGRGFAHVRVARPDAGRWTVRVGRVGSAGAADPVGVTASR